MGKIRRNWIQWSESFIRRIIIVIFVTKLCFSLSLAITSFSVSGIRCLCVPAIFLFIKVVGHVVIWSYIVCSPWVGQRTSIFRRKRLIARNIKLRLICRLVSAHISTSVAIDKGLVLNIIGLSLPANEVLIFSSHKLLTLGIMDYSPKLGHMATFRLAHIELYNWSSLQGPLQF